MRKWLFGTLALAALGWGAGAAQADTVLLRNGDQLEGRAILIGNHVQVHNFEGVTKVPRADVIQIRLSGESSAAAPGRRPGAGIDPDGLYAEALELEERGDGAQARVVRELAAERELRRRARQLTPGDVRGWQRLRDVASAFRLDPELAWALEADAIRGDKVEALAASSDLGSDDEAIDEGPIELTIGPGLLPAEDDAQTALLTSSPRSIDSTFEDTHYGGGGAELEPWQEARSARGLRAPLVVIYPGRTQPPPVAATRYGTPVLFGGGGAVHLRRTSRTTQTRGAINAQARRTFRAVNSQRTLGDQLRSQRRTTAGAANAQGHRTFRGLRGH